MFFRKKKQEETEVILTESELLSISCNGLLTALIHISMSNKWQRGLNTWDLEFGIEIDGSFSCVNLELLKKHNYITNELFKILSIMKSDFMDFDILEETDGFWDIQRERARKVILELWK